MVKDILGGDTRRFTPFTEAPGFSQEITYQDKQLFVWLLSMDNKIHKLFYSYFKHVFAVDKIKDYPPQITIFTQYAYQAWEQAVKSKLISVDKQIQKSSGVFMLRYFSFLLASWFLEYCSSQNFPQPKKDFYSFCFTRTFINSCQSIGNNLTTTQVAIGKMQKEALHLDYVSTYLEESKLLELNQRLVTLIQTIGKGKYEIPLGYAAIPMGGSNNALIEALKVPHNKSITFTVPTADSNQARDKSDADKGKDKADKEVSCKFGDLITYLATNIPKAIDGKAFVSLEKFLQSQQNNAFTPDNEIPVRRRSDYSLAVKPAIVTRESRVISFQLDEEEQQTLRRRLRNTQTTGLEKTE